MRIALDAMGGDHAPDINLEGAVAALSHRQDLEILLVGPSELIENKLTQYSYDHARMHIVHAPQVISNDEAPVMAIRKKRDSSIVVGAKLVRDGEADAFISAGSTGALLAASTLVIKTIKGVIRPALATLMPTTGASVMTIDCGANVDAKPEHLIQFALMGDVYMRTVEKRENPRIGLVNVGTEAEKGNELTKAVYPRLSQMPLNFIGNVEARDIPHGAADVVVCDAFVGNAILKMMEGAATALTQLLKEELTANWMRKLCCLGLKNGFRSFKKKFDYTEYGGAPLLGLNGCVVKAHGSSNAHAIESAIRQAERFVDGKLVETLREQVVHFSDSVGE
jgi:glycerol-3-phosphate acyltransferase PlsX